MRKNDLRSKGDRVAIQQNIVDLEVEIEKLRLSSGFTPEENGEYDLLNKQKEIMEKRADKLEIIIDTIKEGQTRVAEKKLDLISKLQSEISLRSESHFLGTKRLLFEEISLTEKYIDDVDKIYNQYLQRLKSINNNVSLLITKNSNALEPYLSKVTERTKLEQLKAQVVAEQGTIKAIEELDKDLQNRQVKLATVHAKLKNKYLELQEYYARTCNKINSDFRDISKTLKITLEAELQFNSQQFADSFCNSINKQSYFSKLFGNYFNEANYYVFNADQNVENIMDIFKKLLSNTAYNIKYNRGATTQSLSQSLFDDYFHINYKLTQGTENILKMSPGKKGLILLILLLHLSKATYPILIDQPEDNLDNRTIYKELKDFIKTKKTERQIIIVTHNANLVVTTDSENVIVANRDGEEDKRENAKHRFEYISGSLENSFKNKDAIGILNKMGIKEHVCDILEGGEDAFQERESKYGLT